VTQTKKLQRRQAFCAVWRFIPKKRGAAQAFCPKPDNPGMGEN